MKRPLNLLMAMFLSGAGGVACQQIAKSPSEPSESGVTDDRQSVEPEQSKDLAEPAQPDVPAEPVRLELPNSVGDELDRWLWVRKVQPGAEGGWATASFDRDRNKIDIELDGVQAFDLETARTAIDWERPVVLSINGRNSELRRREFTRLEFIRDEHGEWIVKEPETVKPLP